MKHDRIPTMVKVDWTIAEEDVVWLASEAPAHPDESSGNEPATKAVRRKELVMATAVAALLLVLMGGWLAQRQGPDARTTDEVLTAIVQEDRRQPIAKAIGVIPNPVFNKAFNTGFNTASNTESNTVSPTDALALPIQVDKVQRLGDRVMAQVTVRYPEEGKPRPYRETRFFEKIGELWQRIAPDPTLMGPERTLEIAHFVIIYRAVDADAVYEAAPKIEQLYAKLRGDFGVAMAEATLTYTIEVATDKVQTFSNFNSLTHKMSVSSPTLLSAPVEMSAATLLYESIVYPLARFVVFEMIDQYGAGWKQSFSSWRTIVSGLPLWELWEEGGPLAAGHEEVVRWLYENGKSETGRRPFPERYERLCRTYHIWQVKPHELYIPVTCLEPNTSERPSAQLPALPSTWEQPDSNLDGAFAIPVMNETIIEYIVAAYGRKRLPELLAAMGKYPSKESLIPAIFGISVAEFEAGWQVYLEEHYP